jgi:hypothetical protein
LIEALELGSGTQPLTFSIPAGQGKLSDGLVLGLGKSRALLLFSGTLSVWPVVKLTKCAHLALTAIVRGRLPQWVTSG